MKISKIFLLGIVVIAGLIALLSYFMSQEKKSYSDHLGETVIVGKDTAIIVDFSTITETFTLSNKKTVDKRFVIKK